MIYLHNTTEPQVIYVPRNMETPQGDIVFRAKSTIDLAVEVEMVVINLETSALYYNIAVTLPAGVPDGEYEYSLSVGDTIIASGLLAIGGYSDPSQYNKDITYEQYETE